MINRPWNVGVPGTVFSCALAAAPLAADDCRPMPDRLTQQLAFLLEIDRLKQINRQTLIADGTRRENDAEHSWHLAVMASVLAEYGPPGIDIAHATRMLLVHDIVEIDAGDTYCYDQAACLTQHEREQAAADRIFAMLPADQADEIRQLWEEFEA